MDFLEFFEKLYFQGTSRILIMIIVHGNVYDITENICKTNSTKVLRHATMQMTSENMGKHDSGW